jgi:hypothetical protein
VRLILLLCLLLPCAVATADWGTLDADGDGYTTDEGDCNDGDPEINPGAREICEDEIDNDCDTTVDFEDPQCSACGSCHVARGSTAGGVLVMGIVLVVVLGARRRN